MERKGLEFARIVILCQSPWTEPEGKHFVLGSERMLSSGKSQRNEIEAALLR